VSKHGDDIIAPLQFSRYEPNRLSGAEICGIGTWPTGVKCKGAEHARAAEQASSGVEAGYFRV